jgi:Ca2+/Na+ antiporter
MSTPLAVLLFLASVALTLAGAAFFADRLDHLGHRLGLPEAVVGLLAAIAADAPEISSAAVAIARGEKDVGLGVVIGASAFNVATMIGLSAVLAGTVAVGRRTLAVEGGFGLAAAAAAAAVVLGAVPAWLATGALAAAAVPYLVHLRRRPPTPVRPARPEGTAWKPAALVLPAVALVVLGSVGMVRAAVVCSDRLGLARTFVGFVLLAVLASLPNAFTGIRLALAGRGEAAVAETFASNTINLVGGVLVPALAVGLGPRSGLARLDALWVAVLTLLVAVLLAGRIGRRGGALLLGLYAAFVAAQLAYS